MAFVTPSKILRDKMIKNGFPAEKFHHIPTFVDSKSKEPGYTLGNYILYVGAIDPFKGVRELLEAFREMKKSRPLKLVIAGYSLGDEEDRLKAEVEKRNIQGVEFPGFKSGEDLAQLYRGALCVVMPSLWYENMPNVVLEAMAYSKPVIGSDLGGVSEMINDGCDGLLFEVGNVEALRTKLELLAEDEDLGRQLGIAARNKIEVQYAPSRHYERLMMVFEHVVAKKMREH